MALRLGRSPGCGAAKCVGPPGRHGFPPAAGGFFDDDAISGVGVSPLAVKLRPSRHAFLLGGRITGADSVSEALEGLCDGVLGVERRSGNAS